MIADPRPIFVVGTPRSGTTLVARILGRHPTILAAGETHFFEEIWANKHEYGPLDSEPQIAAAVSRLMTIFDRYNQVAGQELVDKLIQPDLLINKVLHNGGGYDMLYQAFTSSLDENKPGLRYCDDTPKHLFYLKTILQYFPNARIIICTRDPRDFLCSYKNFWRASRTPERIRALYHPILTALLWRRSAEIIFNNPFIEKSDRIMTLRYEELVVEPEVFVRELCQFVAVDFNAAMLAVDSHNSSFEQNTDGIFSGSVGKWATCLTTEEAWLVQQINRAQMQNTGYKTADLSPSFLKLAAIFFSTPVALLRILKSNSGRRGPLIPYILRRILSSNQF